MVDDDSYDTEMEKKYQKEKKGKERKGTLLKCLVVLALER